MNSSMVEENSWTAAVSDAARKDRTDISYKPRVLCRFRPSSRSSMSTCLNQADLPDIPHVLRVGASGSLLPRRRTSV